MRSARFTLAGALLALLVSAPIARAEAPNGAYTIVADGESGLLVVEGGVEICVLIKGVEICTSTDLHTNALGGMKGVAGPANDGQIDFTSPTLSADLPLELVAGTVFGAARKPQAAMLLSVVGGTVTENGSERVAGGLAGLRCKQDKNVVTAMFCLGRLDLSSFADSGELISRTVLQIATALTLVERPFALDLELETSEKGIVTGTAGVVFEEPAATLPRLVIGKYDAKSDTVNLKVDGFDFGIAKMVMKRVTFADGTATGGRILYRISGQKGAFTPD
jgi:hypothetical protein